MLVNLEENAEAIGSQQQEQVTGGWVWESITSSKMAAMVIQRCRP